MLSEEDQDALVSVIRNQFVDISKVIGLVDSSRAEEFKKRNTAAKIEHDKRHEHEHHDEGAHSCADITRQYYIPEEHMSSVDKAINARVSTATFFKQRIRLILERANTACKSILARAKERGMVIESDQIKELHAKSMLETVNRLIFQEVYAELKRSDQSVSKQPGLLAHPSTVMSMPDCNLDQLSGDRFTTLMQQGYVIVNDFLAYREAS